MLPTDPAERKQRPITRGVLDYFPDAVAAVAHVSHVGNEQHNPGEPMHWAREKSKDHEDCIARHLIERGTTDTDGLRHTAKLAWRALALLQLELEAAARGEATRTVNLSQVVVPVLEITGGGLFDPLDNPGWSGSETAPRVYVSGPMRGHRQFNFPAFDRARDWWKSHGFRVFSPADLDRADGIEEEPWFESGDVPDCVDNDYFIDRDIAVLRAMEPGTDSLAVLPGWEESRGSLAEIAYANWRGLTIRHAFTGEAVTL